MSNVIRLLRPVSSASLAEALGVVVRGPTRELAGVCRLSDAAPGLLTFEVRDTGVELPPGAVVITTRDASPATSLMSDRPRLAFVKALAWLSEHAGVESRAETSIHETASIASTASIARGVVIGARTVVGHHVRIASNVVVGDDCVIKSGAVVGEDGFGFERDLDGTPLRFLHFGGVRIGNRVEVGSLTTVCQGVLTPTILEDDVKIDDHVHIAHNVCIGKKSLVVACAEVSGSVTLGERVWVGPNASLIEGIRVGDDAFIGLAAVVLRDVADGTTIVGNPGRVLERKP